MTTARVNCLHCGEISVTNLTVYVTLTDHSWYEFQCPDCGTWRNVNITPRVADLLCSTSLPIRLVRPCKELQDPLRHEQGCWRDEILDALNAIAKFPVPDVHAR